MTTTKNITEIKILRELNKKNIHYDIYIDNRLSWKSEKNNILYQAHHIIPAWYELIPNIVTFWTIQFLNNNNIETNWFKIKNSKLYCNNKWTIFLTDENHKHIHKFLETQKKALYELYNLLPLYEDRFKLEEKYKKYYSDRKKVQKKIKNNNETIEIIKTSLKNKTFLNNWKDITDKKPTKKVRREIKNNVRQQSKILYYHVINFIWDNSLIIKNNFNKLLKIISKQNIDINEINETIALIRNKYLKESAIIKTMFSNDLQYTTIKQYNEIIWLNILELKSIDSYIKNIFKLWLTNALKKVTIYINEDWKIISWTELLSYLYIEKLNWIEFCYRILNKEEEQRLIQYLNSKK